MKKLFILSQILYTLFFNKIIAQSTLPPTTEWSKTYGGSMEDRAFSISQTTDGGYILTGETKSNDGDILGNHGASDVLVIKLDNKGDIQWSRTYGGSRNDSSDLIQQTIDGGYIFLGRTNSTDGDLSENIEIGINNWMVKLDSEGNIQWSKILNEYSFNNAGSLQQTQEGGYIYIGTTYDNNVSGYHNGGDVWVLKLDSKGNTEWSRAYGGYGSDEGYTIQQTKDGGYIFAGNTSLTSYGGDLPPIYEQLYGFGWIVKLDPIGDIQWKKNIGGWNQDNILSIQQTTDDGYITAGFTGSNSGEYSSNRGETDIWVIKLDHAGNTLWNKLYGGSLNDGAWNIQQTKDNGYILSGTTVSNDGDISGNHGRSDILAIKLNNSGIIQWSKTYGGSMDEMDGYIQQTKDNGYILVGSTMSNDGDVHGNHGGADIWVIKLKPENSLGIDEITTNKSVMVYPNPAKDFIYITLPDDKEKIKNIYLTDISGKLINTISNTNKVNVSHLSNGVYFLKIETNSSIFKNKFIKK